MKKKSENVKFEKRRDFSISNEMEVKRKNIQRSLSV